MHMVGCYTEAVDGLRRRICIGLCPTTASTAAASNKQKRYHDEEDKTKITICKGEPLRSPCCSHRKGEPLRSPCCSHRKGEPLRSPCCSQLKQSHNCTWLHISLGTYPSG